jgi:tRNA threonylcarbamoyl adenosine modification protein (Sua5/YciO/YrdC/YwlC family)
MTQHFVVHRTNPQIRLLAQAADRLRRGELGVIPTDASYALVCHLGDKAASERLRAIRGIDDKHLLTILCRDLSDLANYALVDNLQYRFLKRWTPGPYTFVLPATKELPKRLAHPARKTIGMRVPQHAVVNELLGQLGEPLLASTLRLPGETDPLNEPDEILEKLSKRIDFLVDDGQHEGAMTTIVEWGDSGPLVSRAGLGFEAIAPEVKL